jgi:hypothetical protein
MAHAWHPPPPPTPPQSTICPSSHLGRWSFLTSPRNPVDQLIWWKYRQADYRCKHSWLQLCSPIHTFHMYSYLVSMCLLLSWCTALLHKDIVDLLSILSTMRSGFSFMRSSSSLPKPQYLTHAAVAAVIYSASQKDNATTFCFCDS